MKTKIDAPFELIVRHVPEPEPIVRKDEPFAFVTMLDSDHFSPRSDWPRRKRDA